MRIAAVDLVSNTCFPALAAQELGFYREEGADVEIELVSQIGATRALREGSADAMIAGSVHDLLREFPGWNGAKLLVALSQGTPWLLTVRADLPAERGDFEALKGLRLTAAEGPDLVFKTLLAAGGLDPERDVSIVHLPGSEARDVSFGVYAARGLASGQIDGFWSNAMGSATAVSSRGGQGPRGRTAGRRSGGSPLLHLRGARDHGRFHRTGARAGGGGRAGHRQGAEGAARGSLEGGPGG